MGWEHAEGGDVMRLHNRQIKASFWTDTCLIQHLTREQRMFYVGLWQLADDSGCLFDDPFAFKIQLYPGDMDITPDILREWRDKLVSLEKLIPYESDGRACLYLKRFHRHQTLRSPAGPTVPLPPWIKWIPSKQHRRSGKYEVLEPYGERTVTMTTPHGDQPEPEPEPEPEGEGEGRGMENHPSPSPLELSILKELQSIDKYPFDYERDLEYIRMLLVEFADVNILDEVKRWVVYKLDKPLKTNSNARSQLRNWMANARKFAKERRDRHDGGHARHNKARGSDNTGAGRAARAGAQRPNTSDYTSGKYGGVFKRTVSAPGEDGGEPDSGTTC